MVSLASQMVSDASSNLQIGTIDFQEEIQLLLIFEGLEGNSGWSGRFGLCL
jgi:hypothetical protein